MPETRKGIKKPRLAVLCYSNW